MFLDFFTSRNEFLDFSRYIENYITIVQTFVDTHQTGNPNVAFWNKIFHQVGKSGSGHVDKLFYL